MSGEGEATRADWLVMCYRDKQLLDIMRSGKIDIMEANEDFLESPVSGLFLVGDLASGPKGGSINYAFNSGVHAVEKACDLYLDCENPA
jgi:thioredoxin reductase